MQTRERILEILAKGPPSAETLSDTSVTSENPNDRKRIGRIRAEVVRWREKAQTAGKGRLIPARPRGAQGSGLKIPVMYLQGSGPERAKQAGAMTKSIFSILLAEFFRQIAPDMMARIMVEGMLMPLAQKLPQDMRQELQKLAKVSDLPLRHAIAFSVMGDFHLGMGCATVVVSAPLTNPNQIIFGRNLDFIGFGLSDVGALLSVHCPDEGSDEIPYASLGWVGLWGVHTGWNAAGLCLGNMQAYNYKDDVPRGPTALLSGRVPTSWAYTTLLRQSRTVAEALDLIAEIKPLAPTNLMLADATGDAALVEWDSNRYRVRRSEKGKLFSTNFFIHPDMMGDSYECWRTGALRHYFRRRTAPIDAETMRVILNDIHQGELTLHSVVFEPAAGKIHFTTDEPPSSSGEWFKIPWNVWENSEILTN